MSNNKKHKSAIAAVGSVIRTTFDGLPIKDGEARLLLTVHTEDVDKATGNEKDAMNCILAKACQRQMHSATVAFFRTVAYIEHANAKGERGVFRYVLSVEARSIIEAFDRGKSVKGEVCIELLPPTKSLTLDHARGKGKALRRRALIAGHIKDESKIRQHDGAVVANWDIRNGSGLVKSILQKPAMGAV